MTVSVLKKLSTGHSNLAVTGNDEAPKVTKEIIMDYGKVVVFHNISSEDFTHSYGGQPFFVKAGDSVTYPYDLADHLATHLARAILLGNARMDKAKLGSDMPLWNEETERELKAKILGEKMTQDVPPTLSEAEEVAKKVEELNAATEGAPLSPDGYKDKSEVIDEMKKLGLPVDARLSKGKLEEQLAQAMKHVAPNQG